MLKSKLYFYCLLQPFVILIFLSKTNAILTNLKRHPLKELKLNKNELIKKQHVGAPIFQPRQTEAPNYDDYPIYDDYYDSEDYSYNEFFDPHKNADIKTSTSSPKFIVKNSTSPSGPSLKNIFSFVEMLLRPTNPNENTIESLSNANENLDYIFSDEHDPMSTERSKMAFTTVKTLVNISKDESQSWQLKDNVCHSKIVYLKDTKSESDYWYLNDCKNKFDSEFCNIKIQANFKSFEIHSTVFCCPNFHLESKDGNHRCVPTNHSINLYEEMKQYLKDFNATMLKHLKEPFENNPVVMQFLYEYEELYDLLTNDKYNTNNSTKYTIYLWDNSKLNDYIRKVMNYYDYNLHQKLDRIINTIKHHIVKFHHITQSIVSNNVSLETMANKKIRLSMINIENQSVEFVNCREIINKNQYYKRINDGTEHNYRLLIHQLQKGSLLIPLTKSVFQIINEKVLKPTSSPNGIITNNFKIFQKLFEQSNQKLTKDLKESIASSITIFVPTDQAFESSLRKDQINSLMSDKTCAYKFITHNIVYEEICPNQLIKYASEYSSPLQRANFIAVNEATSNSLFFNGQIVNLSRSNVNTASDGIIYRLSTLKLNGIVDSLYDIVISFKKEFPPSFISSLNPNWLEIIKSESTNSTLIMPFEKETFSMENKTFKESNNYSKLKDNTNNFSSIEPQNITDYMIRSRVTFYELNDGDILTSLSNKSYLINVYSFEKQVPDYLSFVPNRNFQRKSINCLQLEMPDINACSSQLIVFKSERNALKQLNSISLLDYIAADKDLGIFNNLLNFCDTKCKSLFINLTDKYKFTNASIKRNGFTIVLPTNKYFNKSLQNFSKYSKDMSLFLKSLKANIFYGSYCYFYLRADVLIRNLLEIKVRSKQVASRITEPHVYISKAGLIVHKTDQF